MVERAGLTRLQRPAEEVRDIVDMDIAVGRQTLSHVQAAPVMETDR